MRCVLCLFLQCLKAHPESFAKFSSLPRTLQERRTYDMSLQSCTSWVIHIFLFGQPCALAIFQSCDKILSFLTPVYSGIPWSLLDIEHALTEWRRRYCCLPISEVLILVPPFITSACVTEFKLHTQPR